MCIYIYTHCICFLYVLSGFVLCAVFTEGACTSGKEDEAKKEEEEAATEEETQL